MNFTQRQHRSDAPINASSMADIAFLLLVFFLVATTIEIDKGIQMKLPPVDKQEPTDVSQRNVLSVRLNFDNELMVENTPLALTKLREEAKLHIMNPNGDESRATQPNAAVISLTNDRGTNYRTYLSVYNELKAAYHELWEEQAIARHHRQFDKLTRRQQQELKRSIPLVISEGEIVDWEMADEH